MEMNKSDTMKGLYKLKYWLIVVTMLSLVLSVNAFATVEGPIRQLEPVLEQVMSLLADKNLAGDENREVRRVQVLDVIKEGFDFREMSRRILGKTWRDISEEERVYFIELMTTLLQNTYMDRLETYSENTVVFDSERIKGNRALVETTVGDGRVSLSVKYILVLRENLYWLVYDINIEGVSLVRNYKEQFKSILRKEKFSGLVKLLEKKNQSFAEGQ